MMIFIINLRKERGLLEYFYYFFLFFFNTVIVYILRCNLFCNKYCNFFE